MADSGFLMGEDVEVEVDSGFCMEADSELSLAGRVSVGSDECADIEELDWFVITGHTDSLSNGKEQKEGSTGEDAGSRTQEEGEAESESKTVKDGGTDAQTEEAQEENSGGAFDVCLWPAEEGGGHVRISLEEVERYYRFSRCCHWLRGRCQIFFLIVFSYLLSFL